MSAFSNFTNPYKSPSNVPAHLRNHPNLRRLFQADGSYVRPAEDPVTLWAVEILNKNYSVPFEAMAFEEAVQPEKKWHGRADVVICDDRYINKNGGMDVAFIVLEAIEPGATLNGPNWRDHYDDLEKYMGNSPSARYAILTTGIHTVIYRRDLEYPRTMHEIGDLPQKYESARAAAQHSPYKVIFNPSNPDEIETALIPLTRDKFREVLGDTRSGCHSILRDNEGLQPQEAVDAMVKYLFAKWYDEQATIELVKESGESRAYVFSTSAETDPERLVVQVRETFERAKAWEQRILREKSEANLNTRVAFGEGDTLMFKPHTTVEIVKRLQPWSLRRSSADVKGGVFEDFLGKTFRDDLGQYFTPTPVINLMVGILQPTVDDVIGDPACGSARMLTHALEYVRKAEYQKEVAANGGNTEGINPDEPTPGFLRFRDNNLYGIEYSRNVMHVARVNALMNGAPHVDLKVMDALERLDSVTGGIKDRPGFYEGGLTMILTNPPFGSKLTNKRVLDDFAARDGVTRKNGQTVRSIPQEVAFVNRCLEFLAPGGRLGIVLPDGVLANSSMQDVRDWILRWARLKAIVSLPQETFAPYGAGVKTSVLFVEKRRMPLVAEGQVGLFDEHGEPEEDYEVYMARIDNIGYDATGRLLISENESMFPPEVAESVADCSKRLGWHTLPTG